MGEQKKGMSARADAGKKETPSQRRRLAGFTGKLLLAGAVGTFALGGCVPAKQRCTRTTVDTSAVSAASTESDISYMGGELSPRIAEDPKLLELFKAHPGRFHKLATLGKTRFEIMLSRLSSDSEIANLFASQPDLFVSIATGFRGFREDAIPSWHGEEFLSVIAESPELSELFKTYPKQFSKLASLGEARFSVILNKLPADPELVNLFASQPDLFVSIATGFRGFREDAIPSWHGEEFLSLIAQSPELSELFKTYPKQFSKLASLGEARFEVMLNKLSSVDGFANLFASQPDLFVLIATRYRDFMEDTSSSWKGEEFLSLIAGSPELSDLFKTHPEGFSKLAASDADHFEKTLMRLETDSKFRDAFRAAAQQKSPKSPRACAYYSSPSFGALRNSVITELKKRAGSLRSKASADPQDKVFAAVTIHVGANGNTSFGGSTIVCEGKGCKSSSLPGPDLSHLINRRNIGRPGEKCVLSVYTSL